MINTNIFPYYDDYNENKKFVQILFKPSMAVQARELTQLQTQIQKQIERFGNSIFKEGAMIIPGESSVDLEYSYVKLKQQYQATDINVTLWPNKRVIGLTSGAVANIIEAVPIEGIDENTLYVKYETGDSSLNFTGNTTSGSTTVTNISVDANTRFVVGANIIGVGIPVDTYVAEILSATSIRLSNASTATSTDLVITAKTSAKFADDEVIQTLETSPLYAETIDSDATGLGSRAMIRRGVYYMGGYFLLVDNQSIILDKYSNTPTYRIGIRMLENFVTAIDDSSLNDPASNSTNFNAPGADRLQIDTVFSKYTLTDKVSTNFVEVIRIENGVIISLVDKTAYSELEKTLARRTYDESGDYIVKNFPISMREHLRVGDNQGRYTLAQGGDESKLVAAIEAGKAYVKGYEVEKQSTTYLNVDKARTTDTINNAAFPFSMGSYVNVDNLSGVYNINTYQVANLMDDTSTKIGEARVRGIRFVNGAVGTDAAVYRLFLFDIKMNSGKHFADTRSIETASASSDVVLVGGEANLIQESASNLLLAIPEFAIQSFKDINNNVDSRYSVTRFVNGTFVANSLTLNSGINEVFEAFVGQNYIMTITNASPTAISNGFANGDIVNLADYSVSLGGSPVGKQVTFTVADIAGSAVSIIVPVQKTTAIEKTKTLTNRTVTVPHAAIIQLDRADIFDVVSIMSGGVDIKERYNLDNGQRDSYYDRGRIIWDTSTPAVTGNVTITYRYFEHGVGDYFSVDSYNGVINYDDIQFYQSAVSGMIYDLTNCIDFRPRVNNTGDGFSVTSELIQDSTTFDCDYSYYLGRVDRVFLNSEGVLSIIKGIPADNPVPPAEPKDGITLYTLSVSPFTYGPVHVIVTPIDNKRYTMKDIGRLENRISNLEYYTSLSLLEKDTSDLYIDDGTGQNRFKNGFVVDNFSSHIVGNVALPDYKCSIDTKNNFLRPSFHMDNVSLSVDETNSSFYRKTGSLITLPYTDVVFINQNVASKTENVNPYDVISWVAELSLFPSLDDWFDTETLPDMIIVNESNTANSLAQLGGGYTVWGDWETSWTGTILKETATAPQATKTVLGRTVYYNNLYGIPSNWTITNVQRQNKKLLITSESMVTRQVGQSRTGLRFDVVEKTIEQNLGQRVVSQDSVPFIREKDVEFTARTLKPNTRVYAFFDGLDVNEFCKPINGNYGEELISDNTGFVQGIFSVPNTDTIRFRTGERILRLTDSPTNDPNFTTTAADGLYTAKGMTQQVQNTIVSTRTAELVANTVTEDRTITQTALETRVTKKHADPLAQTFLVEQQGGLFLSKLDLYFATKDPNIPVRIQIRNTVNGYPGQHVVPFSDMTLTPDMVNVSTDGSVATTFTFPSPVYLSEGNEYCFVIMANSIEYTVWVSRMGELDILTGDRISKQPYTGVMFKSQNASTWTADQDQDIKFTLYRCSFDTGVVGTLVLRNNDTNNRTIPQYSLQTTDTSNIVTVRHTNHGFNTGDEVTFSEVIGAVNGIPDAEFNTTHVVTVLDIDTYTITVTSNSNVTGLAGSSFKATTQLKINVLNTNVESISFAGTGLGFSIRYRDASGTSITNSIPILLKENINLPTTGYVFAPDNETTQKSLVVSGDFYTDIDSLSPVIDTERMSAICVSNRINNTLADELAPENGKALAKYITKKISLENPAIGTRVYLTANRPVNSDITVYIKTDSNGEFDENVYTLVPAISYPLADNSEYMDYVFELNDMIPYGVFSIKIVMTSLSDNDVPVIKDFRSIAFGT